MTNLGGGDTAMWLLVVIMVHASLSAGITTNYSPTDSVRWTAYEFSICSADCGGGIQSRTVHCVTSVLGQTEEVPETLCPLPRPSEIQPCNTHPCKWHWTKGEWSECSKTCGAGTQTREVKCQSSLSPNQRYQLSNMQCPGPKPENSRKCDVTDCPEPNSKTRAMISENYTLIQIQKAERIKVNIGGLMKIYPGQSVLVKCHVKHFSKHLTYWAKGYKLVPFMGRIRNVDGSLHIDKADPDTDAGDYVCTAGKLNSTVTIQFVHEDDPLIKTYKKWIKNSKLELKKQTLKFGINSEGSNHVLPAHNVNRADEYHQQRDQSPNSSAVFLYVIAEWTSCNATCMQTRNVTCSQVTPKFVKFVPEVKCTHIGLQKPETVRECLKCAIWQPGPWSECRPSCGQVGSMNRILSCVWESTGQPAFTACDMNNKPVTSKPCKTRPCPSECTDKSRYCSLTSLLKLCKYYHFRRECCHTCQTLQNSEANEVISEIRT